MKQLLSKDPGRRPSATEALSLDFLSCSISGLRRLYEKLVVSPWAAREKSDVILRIVMPNHDTQDAILSCEGNEIVQTDSQMALTEIDANVEDTKERKRQYVDGKENDSQTKEQEMDRRKRRKLIDV